MSSEMGLSKYFHRIHDEFARFGCVLVFLAIMALTFTCPLADPLSGEIASDTTWAGTVEVAGDIVVLCGAQLTIEPGAVILFSANSSTYDDPGGVPNRCDIIIRGALVANGGGAPSDSIVFESAAASGAPGHWGKLLVLPVATDCQLTYASVRHGQVGLEVHGDRTIADCCFSENSSLGLDWSDSTGTVVLSGMIFERNGEDGFRLALADSLNLSGCVFADNGGAGLAVGGPTEVYVDGCVFSQNETAFYATESRNVSFISCTFADNETGIQCATDGLVSLPSATIDGAGVGIDVVSANRLGGLALTGCSIEGSVTFAGCGTASVVNNPILGSVKVYADVPNDTLYLYLSDSDVTGLVDIECYADEAYLGADVRRNDLYSVRVRGHRRSSSGTALAYISAVIDSNEIHGADTAVELGANYPGYPARVDGWVRWNNMSASQYGIYSDRQVGSTLIVTSRGNTISGCSKGVRLWGYGSMTLREDEITGCGTGIYVELGGINIYSCRVTGSSYGVRLKDPREWTTIGGSLGNANDIHNNTTNVYVDYSAQAVSARYNYWGVLDEDSVFTRLTGAVDYSPWTDASHTGEYWSSYQSGSISGDIHWTGEVKVAGDIYVPHGSSLTIDPGAEVKVRSHSSKWDAAGGEAGICDFIVEGVFRVDGGVADTDSVWIHPWIPLQPPVVPVGGEWGSIAYRDSSVDSLCVIGGARLEGATTCVLATDAMPAVRNSYIGATSDYAIYATNDSGPGGIGIDSCHVDGSVKVYADVPDDTLYLHLSDSDVVGDLELNSDGDNAHLWAEVARNSLSYLKMTARCRSGGANRGYIDAFIDSNYISGGAKAISLYTGEDYDKGTIQARLRWNSIFGTEYGIHASMKDGWVGTIYCWCEHNIISGSSNGTAIWYYGNVTVRLLEDDVINSEVGVHADGGWLYVREASFSGLSGSDWAISAAEVDTINIALSEFLDWPDAIFLSSCGGTRIETNQIMNRQCGYGIRCSNSAPYISDNYIDHVDTAIQCDLNAPATIRNNSLACANVYGVFNADSTVVVDAIENWWGDPSGPSGSGPGTGSRVGNHVLFYPWLPDYPNRSPLPFNLLSPDNMSVLDTIPLLDWEDAVDPDCHDVVTYSAYIDQDPGYTSPVILSGLIESQCTFPESLFVGGRQYYWKVRASDGDSLTWSSQTDWSYAVDPSPPSTPQDVTGEGLGTSTRVYWAPNPERDVVSYRTYRGLDSTFVIEEAETVYTSPDTTITISDVDPDIVYYYRVTAMDLAKNESEPSIAIAICSAGASVATATPTIFKISECLPNPMRDIVRIECHLPQRQRVQASVYDVKGRLVSHVFDGIVERGRHQIVWHSMDSKRDLVPAGVYFFRICANGEIITRKILVVK